MSSLRDDVARLHAEGFSQAVIAHRLGVAASTVGYHLEVLRRPPTEPASAPQAAAVRTQVGTRAAVAAMLAEGVKKLEIARVLDVSKSTVSYHARRLGAPVDERGARRYDWATIQRFYDLGNSVDACAKAFGFSHQTWHKAKQRGAIKTRPHTMPLEELCANGVPRRRTHIRKRLVAAGLLVEECAHCRLTEWRGKPAPLELDHINGDRYDHRPENLRLLCPNCHAQTDTYAGRRRSA